MDARGSKASVQSPSVKNFNEVADSYVIVVAYADTTFRAVANVTDIVFKASEILVRLHKSPRYRVRLEWVYCDRRYPQ